MFFKEFFELIVRDQYFGVELHGTSIEKVDQDFDHCRQSYECYLKHWSGLEVFAFFGNPVPSIWPFQRRESLA